MSLPFYHNYNLKSAHLDELRALLHAQINLKHPAVINVRSLDFDQQREVVGLIENHFVTNNISYKFPYPVYIMTDHERTISHMPIVNNQEELPRFFIQRDGKMNVKEAHLVGRNTLLQQEIQNGDPASEDQKLKDYARIHKQISKLETERLFCRNLLSTFMKEKKNG